MYLSNKNKTKLISLFSSIILWLYVTTTIDPSETKTIKDIPVTISNTHLLSENSLCIFPEETLSANITIKTNLSKLKKINRDNIVIYGTISNPAPGKNILTLSSNLAESIRTEIEPTNISINLESVETVSKEVSIIANKKFNTDEYTLTIDKENIELSGTKTLINKVDKITATLKGNSKEDTFSETVELIPIDKDGNKVESIKLSDKYITVTVTKIILEEEQINEVEDNEDNKTKNEKN